MKNFKKLLEIYNNKKSDFKTLSIKKIEMEEIKSIKDSDETLTEIIGERLNKIKTEQVRLENELNSLSNKIICRVNSLENNEMKNVILMRIFTDKTWKCIAKSCLYSEARVRQLYREGINTLTSI